MRETIARRSNEFRYYDVELPEKNEIKSLQRSICDTNKTIEEIEELIESSGNVFKDLNLPNSDALLEQAKIKADLGIGVKQDIYTNQVVKNPILDSLVTIGMWMLLTVGLLVVISFSE